MSDDNKHNIFYFEAPSMSELYQKMETWQNENKKRFLSISVENDQGKLCCIALTNPTEVVIVNQNGSESAYVYQGYLYVRNQQV